MLEYLAPLLDHFQYSDESRQLDQFVHAAEAGDPCHFIYIILVIDSIVGGKRFEREDREGIQKKPAAEIRASDSFQVVDQHEVIVVCCCQKYYDYVKSEKDIYSLIEDVPSELIFLVESDADWSDGAGDDQDEGHYNVPVSLEFIFGVNQVALSVLPIAHSVLL